MKPDLSIVDENVENELNEETIIKEKLILKGHDVRDGIDFSHFNFLVATNSDFLNSVLENEDKSGFDLLEAFWGLMYPYLEAEIKDKENLYSKLKEVASDADITVKDSYNYKYTYEHCLIFLKNHHLGARFDTYMKKKFVELNNKMKKLKEDGTIAQVNEQS